MPFYNFICVCGASHEVLIDFETKKGLEFLCVHCGGVLKAAQVNMFHIINSKRAEQKNSQIKAKPCGHSHHCRCAAIKQTKPNPFQKQIDEALRVNEQ